MGNVTVNVIETDAVFWWATIILQFGVFSVWTGVGVFNNDEGDSEVRSAL